MSGQVQFDGMVPFLDRNTNQMVQVRVWGAFVGQGIDPHEVQPIQSWIMNALAQSAQSYDGQIQALPNMAQEWGGYVSQQLAPGIAAQFQAQGSIQIHGITIDGSGPQAAAPAKAAAPMKAAPVGKAAPMAAAASMAAGAAMGGGGVDPNRIQAAAQALSQQMGVPADQAMQAANIVAQVLGGGAAMGAGAAAAGYHEKQAKEAARQEHQKLNAHAKQGQPGYNKYDQAEKHASYDKQQHDKQAQYGKQPQQYDKQAYDKQAYDKQGYDKQPQYGKQPQQYDKQPQYGKQPQQYDKQGYDKQPQYGKQADPQKYPAKGQPAPAKGHPAKGQPAHYDPPKHDKFKK